MIESLRDRFMLVLGGSSGMGFATATYLARSGANVTITGRTPDKLERARARLVEEFGVPAEKVRTEAGDAQEPEAVVRAVATATGPDGQLDGMFVVAGDGAYLPVLESGLEFATKMWEVNIFPLINAVNAGGPVMVRHGGGSIVALSTVAAGISAPGLAAYGAAKAGVDHYVRCAADELGRHQIRVNCVRSGYTKAGKPAAHYHDDEWNRRFREATPLAEPLPSGRPYGRPEDFGPMVSMLLSKETSWITGQVFAIDGGLSLRGYTGWLLNPTHLPKPF